jgi:hypothetical protein
MTIPTLSPRVAALLEKTRRNRGRLIFALDATASREAMWDLACQLQSAMFEETAKIGGLEIQLVLYRGHNECSHTAWTTDAQGLATQMRRIRCEAGTTKIARVLQHIRTENAREKVNAAILVGDACEEIPAELYDDDAGLPPVFMFQEGDGSAIYIDQRGEYVVDHPPQKVETVFREIARLTNGAWARFDAGAAAKPCCKRSRPSLSAESTRCLICVQTARASFWANSNERVRKILDCDQRRVLRHFIAAHAQPERHSHAGAVNRISNLRRGKASAAHLPTGSDR